MIPRQQKIYELIKQNEFVAIEELAETFSVTRQTIRRDINHLCEQNLLERYHGGARIPSTVENIEYTRRQGLYDMEKAAIAKKVAEMLPNNASVFINLGTTTEEVAKALVTHSGLKVITNNLNVGFILSNNQDCDVIIAGGLVRHRDRGIVGESTIDFIRQFRVDYGIIGISGIEGDGTLTDYDYREVKIAQEIIAHSRQVWLVADHSKFSRSAMIRLGSFTDINALFTDKKPPEESQAMLEKAGVELHVAEEN